MTTMEEPLVWAALGRPDLASLVPGARTRAWLTAQRNIEAACAYRGMTAWFRGPLVIWRLLHTGSEGHRVPPGCTWERLCGRATMDSLLAAVQRKETMNGLRMSTWKTRWLVSPHTVQGDSKRRHLQRSFNAGYIVAVQETHWDTDAGNVWSGLFPSSTVLYTLAPPGPREGRKGGVALLIPPIYRAEELRTVVEGYCVEAAVTRDSTNGGDSNPGRWTVQSLYIPPDDKLRVARSYCQNMAHGRAGPLYVAGDFNLDIISLHHGMTKKLAQVSS